MNLAGAWNSLVELTPMEVQRYHSIQESILQDRVVETASDSGDVLLESDLHLDHIGLVTVTLSERSLVWQSKSMEDKLESFSLSCFRLASLPHEFPLSEIYGVESFGWGPVRKFVGASAVHRLLKPMHRFSIHSFQRLRNSRSKWLPRTYDFAHPELEVCHRWVKCLHNLLSKDHKRPKDLLVLINPFGGKGIASSKWAMVSPLFSRAGIKTKVVTTERAGHAYDMMYNATDDELKCHDGIVMVGGDGIFNEVINGLALKRHQASSVLTPHQISQLITSHRSQSLKAEEEAALLGESRLCSETSSSILSEPLLVHALSNSCKFAPLVPWLRFGIIPAGSTDTIVVSTTGTRDPVTAALHIILGDSMPLDIVRLTGWKESKQPKAPVIRYAASFSGYGFYGDVARESESLRWMGPSRYDYAGTKVFMRHRKYEAEVSYLDVPNVSQSICCVHCRVCAKEHSLPQDVGQLLWITKRAFFHSVGAAIMSCRNDKAPDGVVAHAHLADGLLHLVLVKQCSRPAYLMHLIQLTRRGGNPLGLDFIELHKTPLFTFVAHGDESVWNVDGEILAANKLGGQVFRGLINFFALGPEEQ
ncbi:ceramide kinase isoform X2 [Selaginella moellendorffii]|uniref:ceramide kinase isoform X2 n=1 Tax=Selaginella moellendorffii TaxID=88036 RepID=UPI000D1CDC26|nr:ceramide kinase isoform X2 [Selaginella moellendorffii]|eukprot:XP_024530898.1 ceramide kinase isoform X2 [Selaginella moellendorffii]